MEPVSVEFTSEGACLRGEFFAATGAPAQATLLFVPGWPGDPDDALGLGPQLAERGVSFCRFNPRGLSPSEGISSHAGTLRDIAAAQGWLRRADVQSQLGIDAAGLILGGYSYGGGMAMAYAAQDPSVRRVISVAGNDHGEFVRELQRNAAFAGYIRAWLVSTQAPEGPARFDLEASFQEFVDHPDVFGLRENAANLADRSILLIGGWEDQGPTVDKYQLPLYRALKSAGAKDVTFIVYHADHSFKNVRQRLAADIAGWILREEAAAIEGV